MTKVSSHFVRGNDPKKFASMLINFMGKVMVLFSAVGNYV
jgi:hypothetical protein